VPDAVLVIDLLRHLQQVIETCRRD